MESILDSIACGEREKEEKSDLERIKRVNEEREREREWEREREREESRESESVQNVKQRRSKKERMCEHRTKW